MGTPPRVSNRMGTARARTVAHAPRGVTLICGGAYALRAPMSIAHRDGRMAGIRPSSLKGKRVSVGSPLQEYANLFPKQIFAMFSQFRKRDKHRCRGSGELKVIAAVPTSRQSHCRMA